MEETRDAGAAMSHRASPSGVTAGGLVDGAIAIEVGAEHPNTAASMVIVRFTACLLFPPSVGLW
jgi:hypothetical protein